MEELRPTITERRRQTRNKMYRYIYDAEIPVSKQQIATSMGYSLPTVHQNIAELLDAGLIRPGEVQKSTGGRPAVGYTIDETVRYAVGISVSATHLRFLATDVRQNELAYKIISLASADGEKIGEQIAEELEMPVSKVREIMKIAQEPVSLETPIGEEEDSHLGDFIEDKEMMIPADAAAYTLLKEQLLEVLDTLTDREQKVLRLRFGLDDGRSRTLEEVGKEFNVTRERIRQIEAKALRKLRHPSRSKKLRDYLE